MTQEFPGSPVIRTQHFHFHVLGSIPGLGTKIPQGVAKRQKKKLKASAFNQGKRETDDENEHLCVFSVVSTLSIFVESSWNYST